MEYRRSRRMKRKKAIKRSGRGTRRRTLLLSRKARIGRGRSRRVRYGRAPKGLLVRKKRRQRRRIVQKIQVVHPSVQPIVQPVVQPPVHMVPVQVVPVVEAPPAPQVVQLPRILASLRKRRRETPFSRATPKHTTWGSTPVSPRASRTGISWSWAETSKAKG